MREKYLRRARAALAMALKRAHDIVLAKAFKLLDMIKKERHREVQRIADILSIYYPEEKMDMDHVFEFLKNPKIPADSVGLKIKDTDKKLIEILSRHLENLNHTIEKLEEHIKKMSYEIMPNAANLVGPLLAAEMLAKAGSLEKLAKMPAGTIQVLGAERSLFRHLTKGSKPPKHGILFKHPYISGLPRDKRGKAARALATKLSMAFRADYYTKREIWPTLKKQLEARMEEITNAADGHTAVS